jgi:hypothetical protein
MDYESDPATRALHARGLPVGLSGVLPESLFARIAERELSMRPEFDLIYHGAVPIDPSAEEADLHQPPALPVVQ